MFKCEVCKRITKPGEKQYKKIIKTRNKIYNSFDKYGNERISRGYEIVKELNVCEDCKEEVKINE